MWRSVSQMRRTITRSRFSCDFAALRGRLVRQRAADTIQRGAALRQRHAIVRELCDGEGRRLFGGKSAPALQPVQVLPDPVIFEDDFHAVRDGAKGSVIGGIAGAPGECLEDGAVGVPVLALLNHREPHKRGPSPGIRGLACRRGPAAGASIASRMRLWRYRRSTETICPAWPCPGRSRRRSHAAAGVRQDRADRPVGVFRAASDSRRGHQGRGPKPVGMPIVGRVCEQTDLP